MSTSLAGQIAKLQELRNHYLIQAADLPADLALLGLVDDVLDATSVALQLLETSRPHRAYAMARAAFEATQRIVVLATDEDFCRLGTRAWLFYRRKDERLGGRPQSAPLVAPEEAQLDETEAIISAWERYFPPARDLVSEETAVLDRMRGPDNFMGRNLADVLDERYPALAARKGRPAPPKMAEHNRAIYSALSREAHARLRLEPASLRIDADGFVDVQPRPYHPGTIRKGVLGALESLLGEAISATDHRSRCRRESHALRVQQALTEQALPPLPDGYVPDFGITLLESGIGAAMLVLPNVRIATFRAMEDGTISGCSTSGSGGDRQIASFDFKGEARLALRTILSRRVDPTFLFRDPAPQRLDLGEPIVLFLKASLGEIQRTDTQVFVPLIVHEVADTSPVPPEKGRT